MFLWAAVLLSSLAISAARYGCKNPQGQDVDWFVTYKMPSLSGNANKPISQGYGHYYMDASTNGWQIQTVGLDQANGHAIAETLKQLYAAQHASGEVFIGMYNDEWPNDQTSSNYGHTKGNLVSDKEGGYWMIHSTPKFPSEKAYEWPQTARKFGQSFLCISFNYDQLKQIGVQLTYNQPWLYYNKLTPGIEADCPELRAIINLNFVSAAPFNRAACLMSRGGMSFTSFAKHKKFQNDVYFLIADTLKTPMHAETWINGAKNLPTWCDAGIEMHNITQIKFPDGNTFTTSNDHSKFCVSDNCASSGGWMCIGDINRQYSQFQRGGGLVCFQHKAVCNSYRQLIDHSMPCGSGGDPAPKFENPTIDHQCPIGAGGGGSGGGGDINGGDSNVSWDPACTPAKKAQLCAKTRRTWANTNCPGFC